LTQPERPDQPTISADCAAVLVDCARLIDLLEPVAVPVHVQVVAQRLTASLAALTADLEAAQPRQQRPDPPPPCSSGPFF
jgi:hypothetical protein